MRSIKSNIKKLKVSEKQAFSSMYLLSILLVTCLFSCNNGPYQHQVALEKFSYEEEAMMSTEVETAVEYNTESYDRIYENQFMNVVQNPLSTFSIDVDNASYSNVRRFLNSSQLPPKDAVRIEEMINYFDYNYPEPHGNHPFSFNTEIGECPWNKQHKLIHIGIKGKSIDYNDHKPSNLVFLIDASGSMEYQNKMPLLKKSVKLLVDALDKNDRVAIVAYAGAAGLVLPSTPVKDKETILNAIDKITAGGSTAGGQGIELAYAVAKENLISNGNNRVILATDGDFNVGISSPSELVRLIEEKRKDDIYLTICGFGIGNYKDGTMEQISNAGNGNYFYIDNIREAEKVFVTQLRSNLFTIAKDVKIQVEFNPVKVQSYRLIGYENRMLDKEDFNDDKKDAGELGAGHTVTALYEIVPAGAENKARQTDPLKYQKSELTENAGGEEYLTIKFRYKPVKSDESILIESTVTDRFYDSDNFRFSAAVAGFGLLLRDSEFKGDLTYDKVLALAETSDTDDKEGYRHEFAELVRTAKLLDKQ